MSSHDAPGRSSMMQGWITALWQRCGEGNTTQTDERWTVQEKIKTHYSLSQHDRDPNITLDKNRDHNLSMFAKRILSVCLTHLHALTPASADWAGAALCINPSFILSPISITILTQPQLETWTQAARTAGRRNRPSLMCTGALGNDPNWMELNNQTCKKSTTLSGSVNTTHSAGYTKLVMIFSLPAVTDRIMHLK